MENLQHLSHLVIPGERKLVEGNSMDRLGPRCLLPRMVEAETLARDD